MNDWRKRLRAAAILVSILLPVCVAAPVESPARYDLGKVKGMDRFGGSAGARALLARNGFVVADPPFRQIFEPYIESRLPLFITTDSAWHTYHVLLEEGVKELETIQAKRLARLSAWLWQAANERSAKGEADFADLARYASIGLAFQDPKHRESLGPAEKDLIDKLRAGVGEAQGPAGFPLSAANFRAASFYTKSPELSDYFSARQWYAGVVFRLQDARETRLALQLARLISTNDAALTLWRQLSAPLDLLLAPAEDGDVRSYGEVAAKVFADGATLAGERLAEAQKQLAARLPAPRVNDQLLSPDQYAQFGELIRGFRLLPPRQLPCALVFHQTTDPAVPGRMFPSGLDFLVASPTLRSPAAVRALELQAGKGAAAVQKLNCEPFPDTLHGAAMKLLACLQKPLPLQAPPALRTAAWADSQLWTQLGAWAEQRHTWALHTKLNVMYLGMTEAPPGMVAPYPEFFAGLGVLARQTAEALEQAGSVEPFTIESAGAAMLPQIKLWRQFHAASEEGGLSQEELMSAWAKVAEFDRFFDSYLGKRLAGATDDGARQKALDKALGDLESLARRAADTGQASATETELLRQFAAASEKVPELLRKFVPVCERLAELARKLLAGRKLTEADSNWISAYGIALAMFHFYEGNSYLEPRDDFPMVTRVFASPVAGSILYAGLGRPQALYVIVPVGGKQQLYRGAVMTYREFARDAQSPLDDESWQKEVFAGLAPAPPAFTRSFYAEISSKELISLLGHLPKPKNDDAVDELDAKVKQAAELLRSRATTADLPDLFALLRSPELRDLDEDVPVALAETLTRLVTPKDVTNLIALITETRAAETGAPDGLMRALANAVMAVEWEPYKAQLTSLLTHINADVAVAAAHVLASKPEALDVRALAAAFERQPPFARRLYCRLFGKAINKAEASQTLLRAARDGDAGVRRQAIAAIYTSNWTNAHGIAALTARLSDTNQCVAAAAAFVLGKFGATEAAPVLLDKLKSCKLSVPPSAAERSSQASAVSEREMHLSQWPWEPNRLPDFSPARPPQAPFPATDLRTMIGLRRFRLERPLELAFNDSLIQALGELNYAPAAELLLPELGGASHVAAVTALKRLSPERLENALLTTACDRQADSGRRALALMTLSGLPAKARVRELLPLLDETTALITDPRGSSWNWRLCDHAAAVMAKLLDWELPNLFTEPTRRDELIKRLREWSATKP